MKSKTQKITELKRLKLKFPKSEITIFTTFSRAGEKGLSVAQMTQLKRALKEIQSEYFVTKKTLMDLALKDLKYDGADVFGMEGSVGLVFGQDNSYAVAKKLYEFSRKNPALQFFGAIFENNFIDKERFLEIAKMPSRETLLGRLFGMMKYPVTGLCVVLGEISKKHASAS